MPTPTLPQEDNLETSTLILDEKGNLIKGSKPLFKCTSVPDWGGDETAEEIMQTIEDGRKSNADPVKI